MFSAKLERRSDQDVSDRNLSKKLQSGNIHHPLSLTSTTFACPQVKDTHKKEEDCDDESEEMNREREEDRGSLRKSFGKIQRRLSNLNVQDPVITVTLHL